MKSLVRWSEPEAEGEEMMGFDNVPKKGRIKIGRGDYIRVVPLLNACKLKMKVDRQRIVENNAGSAKGEISTFNDPLGYLQ